MSEIACHGADEANHAVVIVRHESSGIHYAEHVRIAQAEVRLYFKLSDEHIAYCHGKLLDTRNIP